MTKLYLTHFNFRKRQLQAEREKAEMPNFGPTIIPEPDPTPPSTPIGSFYISPTLMELSDISSDLMDLLYTYVSVHIDNANKLNDQGKCRYIHADAYRSVTIPVLVLVSRTDKIYFISRKSALVYFYIWFYHSMFWLCTCFHCNIFLFLFHFGNSYLRKKKTVLHFFFWIFVTFISFLLMHGNTWTSVMVSTRTLLVVYQLSLFCFLFLFFYTLFFFLITLK